MLIPFGCSFFLLPFHSQILATQNNEINDIRSLDCNKQLWENVVATTATRFVFIGWKTNTEGEKMASTNSNCVFEIKLMARQFENWKINNTQYQKKGVRTKRHIIYFVGCHKAIFPYPLYSLFSFLLHWHVLITHLLCCRREILINSIE